MAFWRPTSRTDAITGVAVLADPVRRAVYDAVAESSESLSRDEVAAAAGVPRATAVFHLDKLAAEGLLEVDFRRLTGRTGPGAGRPSKLYRRSDREIEVSIPPRRYDLAGHLLAAAVAESDRSGTTVRASLAKRAHAFGRELGQAARSRVAGRASGAARRRAVVDVLAEHGFEPAEEGRRTVLRNCPFHALAQEHTDLVCGMNLDLMRGVMDEADAGVVPRLDPEPGRCCVVLERS